MPLRSQHSHNYRLKRDWTWQKVMRREQLNVPDKPKRVVFIRDKLYAVLFDTWFLLFCPPLPQSPPWGTVFIFLAFDPLFTFLHGQVYTTWLNLWHSLSLNIFICTFSALSLCWFASWGPLDLHTLFTFVSFLCDCTWNAVLFQCFPYYIKRLRLFLYSAIIFTSPLNRESGC